MSDLPPREFVRAVRDFCRGHGLLRRGDRVVVGVSGGPDSLALLHALRELAVPWRLRLTVAHVDHALRRTSARDGAFVRRMALALGLPFHSTRVDIGRLAKRRKISVEEAGRLARYSFFHRVALATRSRVVTVGHQRDDQAETVLLRLVRGASGSGLAGIAPARPLDDPLGFRRPSKVVLIRPLLDRSRAEIEAFLDWRGIRALRDPSNADADFTRNRVRRELLPLLERRFNPRITAALARAALALAEDDAVLESLAERVRSPLRIAALARLPVAVRRRVLRNAAVRAGAVLNRLTQAHLDALVRLVDAGSGSTDLPGLRAGAGRGRIAFRRWSA